MRQLRPYITSLYLAMPIVALLFWLRRNRKSDLQLQPPNTFSVQCAPSPASTSTESAAQGPGSHTRWFEVAFFVLIAGLFAVLGFSILPQDTLARVTNGPDDFYVGAPGASFRDEEIPGATYDFAIRNTGDVATVSALLQIADPRQISMRPWSTTIAVTLPWGGPPEGQRISCSGPLPAMADNCWGIRPGYGPSWEDALVSDISEQRKSRPATWTFRSPDALGYSIGSSDVNVTLPGCGLFSVKNVRIRATYYIPDGTSYQWSGAPPTRFFPGAVQWFYDCSEDATFPRFARGVQESFRADNNNSVFVSGLLFGLAGAALIGGAQAAFAATASRER